MPLNIEFCLGLKIDLKHNSVASVLLPSSSRGFLKKKEKKSELVESRAEGEGKEEAV